MKRVFIIPLLFLLSSCQIVESIEPENLNTNPLYVLWWVETLECADANKGILLSNIKFTTPVTVTANDGLNIHANWIAPYKIEIAAPYKLEKKTVRHVMLHAMLQNLHHPKEFSQCNL